MDKPSRRGPRKLGLDGLMGTSISGRGQGIVFDDIPIGRNFVIEHSGGIVISGFASFGDDCRIRNGVVVGLSRVDEPCAPQIGNDVDIGTGAKVLGNIRIGNGVRIGANAVVIMDVPDDCLAVGVPATIKPRRKNPS